MEDNKYYLGLDVGSTTVKGVLMYNRDSALKTIWKCYERHETRQAEKVLEFFKELEVLYPAIFRPAAKNLEIFIILPVSSILFPKLAGMASRATSS